ncbi:transposase [Solidesulfovibrio sp.]
MRLLKVPGIGPLSATAIVAAVSQAKEFKNRREFFAWLGRNRNITLTAISDIICYSECTKFYLTRYCYEKFDRRNCSNCIPCHFSNSVCESTDG